MNSYCLRNRRSHSNDEATCAAKGHISVAACLCRARPAAKSARRNHRLLPDHRQYNRCSRRGHWRDAGNLVMGIDTAGDVAGTYIDTMGVSHGFVSPPMARLKTFDSSCHTPGKNGSQAREPSSRTSVRRETSLVIPYPVIPAGPSVDPNRGSDLCAPLTAP